MKLFIITLRWILFAVLSFFIISTSSFALRIGLILILPFSIPIEAIYSLLAHIFSRKLIRIISIMSMCVSSTLLIFSFISSNQSIQPQTLNNDSISIQTASNDSVYNEPLYGNATLQLNRYISEIKKESENEPTEISGITVKKEKSYVLSDNLCESDVFPDVFSPVESASISVSDTNDTEQMFPTELEYVLNTNTKKFHKPDCSYVKRISEKNRRNYGGTREELERMEYAPCKVCNP